MDSGIGSLIFLFLLIAIFYFMLIRPQKRRVQQHQQLVDSIQVGDEVITIGGMHGRISFLGEEDVELEIAPGTRVSFLKTAISRRVTEDAQEAGDTGDIGEDAATDADTAEDGRA